MHVTNHLPAAASGTFTIGDDVTVHRFGFGAMRITGPGIWGPPADRQGARALLRRTVELGINLIDTADSYGPNVSEELIADALHPYPPNLVIATKGGLIRTGPGQWPLDGRPHHLRAALDGSLTRLRVDQIDLYQFHRPDPSVPFEDSVGALAQLRAEGKIRHVGLSNVTLDELARAQQIVPIVTVQNHYNLAKRQSERMNMADSEAMIDLCAQQGIGFIPWAPLSLGALAEPGSALVQIAQRHAATPNQIVVAWLLQRSSTMLPIPGTSSMQHLEENVAGAAIRLHQDDFDAIDQAARAGQEGDDAGAQS